MQFATAWQPKLQRVLFGLGALSCLCVTLITQYATADEPVADSDQLKKVASWTWPDLPLLEQHLLSYLDQVQASEATRHKVMEQWKATADAIKGPALLERVLQVASIIEPKIAQLVARLDDPESPPVLVKDLTWLASDVPGWLQDAVRLACGRALAQRQLYDESLETLSGLQASQVCDPASLIFYRSVCQHHLLQKKECLANVDLLLERSEELPMRYAQVAQLMSADIKPLKTDSLDEVARMMNGVQRRLGLGRAGKQVREEEKEIIAKLDKMIEQMEEQLQQQQQQQQQQQSQSQGRNQQGQSRPMEQSQQAGGPIAPGDVDQKNIGKRDGWGNLPPAERQASLQRMTQELPSHYREVIEGYFRQLAKEKQ